MSHEYYVCQRIGLGQAIYLVENLARGELTLKSLLAGLAEKAIHLATHLGRDTERGAVSVWYIDSLHVLALGGGEKILHRAVHGVPLIYRGGAAHLIDFRQSFPVLLREIGHLVYAPHAVLIEPLGHLPSGESGHTQLLGDLSQFRQSESQQGFLVSVHVREDNLNRGEYKIKSPLFHFY